MESIRRFIYFSLSFIIVFLIGLLSLLVPSPVHAVMGDTRYTEIIYNDRDGSCGYYISQQDTSYSRSSGVAQAIGIIPEEEQVSWPHFQIKYNGYGGADTYVSISRYGISGPNSTWHDGNEKAFSFQSRYPFPRFTRTSIPDLSYGCEPPPSPCDEEYNSALSQCSGDEEKLEVISLEEGNCLIQCSPCKGPDKSLAKATEQCGGSQKLLNYNFQTCEADCQDTPCEAQWDKLVQECGGADYIHSFDTELCKGTCESCSNEVIEAIKVCGDGGYIMDENCNYNCTTCDQEFNRCIDRCGGEENIISFSCDDEGTKTTASPCVCIDTPINPIPDPDPNLPPESIDKDYSRVINPDGSYTDTYTTYKKNDDGTYTKETKTTKYDPNGTELSSQTSKEQSTQKPEGMEEGKPEEDFKTGVKREIDFSPLKNATAGIGNKFPLSVVSGIVGHLNIFKATPKAPTFTGSMFGYNIEIPLEFWDPVAEFGRTLLSIVIFCLGCFTIVRVWMAS